MPILSETEASILEHLRNGHHPLQIAKLIGKHERTITYRIRQMLKTNWIHKTERGKYQVILQDYIVKKYKPQPPPTPSAHTEKWYQQTLKMVTVELSEEQLFYLDNHRHLKRTLLAKKLGISKLQLCYVLEKRGTGA